MKVFLSYRRDDTGGRAGRLFDMLGDRLGTRNVFQDVNAVAPGLDFTTQVEAAIETSDVVLVVIGPNWLGEHDPDGRRRLDSPDDFVRQEVSQALTADIPVVPVLVDDASLPPADDLPADLRSLVYRHAVELRDVSWHADVDLLIRRLEGDDAIAGRPRSRHRVLAGVGLITAVAAGSVAVLVWRGNGTPAETEGSAVSDPTPISLPDTLEPERTWQGTRTCSGGGRIEVSAGPVQLDDDIMSTEFDVVAHGLQTDTIFDPIRVVDDDGAPYGEIDAGELNGGFDLDQDGYGVTARSTTVSVNRDSLAHPDAEAIVLVVTGECDDNPMLIPLAIPAP